MRRRSLLVAINPTPYTRRNRQLIRPLDYVTLTREMDREPDGRPAKKARKGGRVSGGKYQY